MVLIAIIIASQLYRNGKWHKTQAMVFPFFVFYLCLIMGITIFNRLPYDDALYKTDLFWSYREAVNSKRLLLEIILNYCMMIPMGVLLPLYINKRCTFLVGFTFSMMIEIMQFYMRRGLFEFDDIIGNTFGVVIGVLLYIAANKIWRKDQ